MHSTGLLGCTPHRVWVAFKSLKKKGNLLVICLFSHISPIHPPVHSSHPPIHNLLSTIYSPIHPLSYPVIIHVQPTSFPLTHIFPQYPPIYLSVHLDGVYSPMYSPILWSFHPPGHIPVYLFTQSFENHPFIYPSTCSSIHMEQLPIHPPTSVCHWWMLFTYLSVKETFPQRSITA